MSHRLSKQCYIKNMKDYTACPGGPYSPYGQSAKNIYIEKTLKKP